MQGLRFKNKFLSNILSKHTKALTVRAALNNRDGHFQLLMNLACEELVLKSSAFTFYTLFTF